MVEKLRKPFVLPVISFLILAGVLFPHPLAAQVSVTLIVRNPMPAQLSVWEHDPTVIQLIIIDPAGRLYQNIRASFVVEDLNKNSVEVLKSKDSDPSMPRFDIGPSVTTTRFTPDIININAISYNTSYQSLAQSTNSIPEGNYQICVTLIDQNNNPIGTTARVCMPFNVIVPDPPVLTHPVNEAVISALAPTSFNWTPVMLGATHVDYQMTIAPIFQNQTPHDAIQSNTPLFQKRISLNSYIYTQADPPFSFYPSANAFAWQVQALDQQNLPAAKGEGKSEIFTFTLQGSSGSPQQLTLQQDYPLNNDTIPWIPPHMIVKFDPYSDAITRMEYTLTVSGSDNSSYSVSRTLDWKQGPRISQGWSSLADTDRARYIIADLQFTGNNNSSVSIPAWTYSLKRGMKYNWSVNAKFTLGANIIPVGTGTRTFVVGATSPYLVSPSNKAVIDTTGLPITLVWANSRPNTLNPPSLFGMGSSQQKSEIKGAAKEQYRIELSQDSLFISIDTTQTIDVPLLIDSTGGNASGLYGNHSFTLAKLQSGKYFWRTAWLDKGKPYCTSDVWSFQIGTDTSQQKNQQPNQQQNQCGANYIAAVPSDQTATSGTFSVGQTIRVGLFTMIVSKVTSATGTNFTGEGTIGVPYLHAPMMVEFNGLKVNKKAEVVGGKVTAKMDPGSPIPSTVANQLGSLGLKNSDITSIMKLAGQAAKLVSGLTTKTPVGLPIGLDNAVDGFPMTIGIIGMVFTDTIATLNAVASYLLPDLGPNIGLGVGARGIPLQPGGLGINEGTLYLAEDIGVDQSGSFGFRFKAPTQSDSGTYMMWDCKGFKELRLRADILFPRDWLIPVPDNSEKVAAKILTTVRKPGDWIASVSMDSCEIVGSSGMILSVKEMTYDHSDVQNPIGIVFPPNYPKGTPGSDWHGFFIKNATVTLPKELQTFQGGAPKINVNNMIIDGAGFTASFIASNVIQYPQGNFGEWGASIDTVSVNFVCSSLTDGRMAGRFQIPIADSALVYSATLSTLQSGKMKFLFNIHPTSEVKASVWCATLGLDPSSRIELADSSGKFWATATLNGNFSINGKVGDLPKIDLQLLQFQNVVLTTNAPYIKTGTWKFGSPDHSMSGFPITLSDVGIATGQRKNGFGVGLKFSFKANLSDIISGQTSLSIWGVLNLGNSSGQKFAFDGVDVDTIKIKADLGAVFAEGSIVLYHDDATFGNGFRGAISATFVKTVKVEAVAQFGSVNGYRYWYVDASAIFESGITFGPVAMYGIGGGAWYHMKAGDLPSSINGSPSPASAAGSSLSGLTFTPDQTVDLGFLANAHVGISGGKQVFVCGITLGAQFVNGGIGSMFLTGKGYILSSETSVIDILSKQDATVLADVSIKYDFVNSVFEGNFQFQTGSKYKNVFLAQGEMNFHFDPVNWHVLIGTPDKRIKLTLLSLAKVDAYIMAGTDIPAPDFNNFQHKSDIEQAIGQKLPVARSPLSGGPVSGFALGASLSYTGDFTFLVFYAHMDFGMGFDMAIINMSNAVCSNSNEPVGINGWFGYGDLYAYVNFKMGIRVDMTFVKGDFPILDMGAGALCRFQAPNPIWVQGIVGGHFSILGGLVEGHAAFTFEIGEKCAVAAENPLKIDLFTGTAPENGATNINVFATPSVSIRFPIDQEVDLQTPDKNGNPSTKSYRIVFEDFTLKDMSNNSPIPGRSEKSQDGYTEFFVSDKPLPSHATVLVAVKVQGFELVNSQWVVTKDGNGNDIVQDTSFTFTVGQCPDSLVADNIAWSIPLDRQRYFLFGEHQQGKIYLNIDRPELFSVDGTYIARFLPINGGQSQDKTITYDENSKTISFPLPQLQPSTEYALQIVRQTKPQFLALSMKMKNSVSLGGKMTVAAKSGVLAKDYSGGIGGLDSLNIASPKFVPAGLKIRANEKLLYVLYFQTSKHATLADKINQLKFSKTDYAQYWNIFEDLAASFASDEWWDVYDMQGFVKHGRNQNDDQQSDPLILVDAVHTNQTWFNGYAKPSIYNHIFDLAVRGLWFTSVPIADGRVYGQASWTHPDPQAAYTSLSFGPISVPYVSTSPQSKSLAQSFHSSTIMGSSASVYTLKVKYLHGTNIPADFNSLYYASSRVLYEYYAGDADVDGSEIYGKGDWIQNNLGWMQDLGGRSIFNFNALYTPIYQDNYTVDFAYSPKFDWNVNGPWVSKNFTYGSPNVLQMAQPIKPSTNSAVKKLIIHH